MKNRYLLLKALLSFLSLGHIQGAYPKFAVGLGNIWRFPNVTYRYSTMYRGVAVVLFSVLACVPVLAQEVEQVSSVLITNVNIFDGKSDNLQQDMSLLVEGNKIARIASSISAPENSTTIDGAGRTLMPGLIEAHGHLFPNVSAETGTALMYWDESGARMAHRAEHYLDLGFTTVRDTAGWVMGVKRAIDDGTIPGPRIYAAGPGISQTAGHGDFRLPFQRNPYMGRLPENPRPVVGNLNKLGHATLADGVDEVRKAVRENLAAGSAFIKVMAGGGIASMADPLQSVQYTKEELAAAQQEAANYGTYVTAHAHMDDAINSALDAGIRHFEHASIMSDETMRRLGKAGAYICPSAYLFLQPPEENTSWTNNIQRAKAQLAYDGVDNVLRNAGKYGIKVLWGTDVIGPAATFEKLVKEWEYRAPYFPNVEQLKQATSINAEVLALTTFRNPYPAGPLGVIEEGAYADLLLVDGNPLENIMLMTEPRKNFHLIMKDGKIHKNTVDNNSL